MNPEVQIEFRGFYFEKYGVNLCKEKGDHKISL